MPKNENKITASARNATPNTAAACASLLMWQTGFEHVYLQEERMSDIVELRRFSSEFGAQLALAHLTSEVINASMVTDDGGGALPNLSMLSGGVRLIVRAEDVKAAEEALKVLDDDETSEDG